MAPQWLRTLFLATILAGQGIVNGLTLDVDDEGEIALIAGYHRIPQLIDLHSIHQRYRWKSRLQHHVLLPLQRIL